MNTGQVNCIALPLVTQLASNELSVQVADVAESGQLQAGTFAGLLQGIRNGLHQKVRTEPGHPSISLPQPGGQLDTPAAEAGMPADELPARLTVAAQAVIVKPAAPKEKGLAAKNGEAVAVPDALSQMVVAAYAQSGRTLDVNDVKPEAVDRLQSVAGVEEPSSVIVSGAARQRTEPATVVRLQASAAPEQTVTPVAESNQPGRPADIAVAGKSPLPVGEPLPQAENVVAGTRVPASAVPAQSVLSGGAPDVNMTASRTQANAGTAVRLREVVPAAVRVEQTALNHDTPLAANPAGVQAGEPVNRTAAVVDLPYQFEAVHVSTAVKQPAAALAGPQHTVIAGSEVAVAAVPAADEATLPASASVSPSPQADRMSDVNIPTTPHVDSAQNGAKAADYSQVTTGQLKVQSGQATNQKSELPVPKRTATHGDTPATPPVVVPDVHQAQAAEATARAVRLDVPHETQPPPLTGATPPVFRMEPAVTKQLPADSGAREAVATDVQPEVKSAGKPDVNKPSPDRDQNTTAVAAEPAPAQLEKMKLTATQPEASTVVTPEEGGTLQPVGNTADVSGNTQTPASRVDQTGLSMDGMAASTAVSSPDVELEMYLSQARPITARATGAPVSAGSRPAVPGAETRSTRQKPADGQHFEEVRTGSEKNNVKEMAQSLQAVASGDGSLEDPTASSPGESGMGQPDSSFASQMQTQDMHGQLKTDHQRVSQASVKPVSEPVRQESSDQIMQQVRERLVQHEVKPGNQQITLTLSPDSLGELKMNMNLQGHKLTVEIVTDNRTVRDAIVQHTDALKESLARQNITMESFDVTTGGGRGFGNQGQNQGAWRELAKQQQQQQFWTAPRGYNTAQADVPTGHAVYKKQQGQSMLDIHY